MGCCESIESDPEYEYTSGPIVRHGQTNHGANYERNYPQTYAPTVTSHNYRPNTGNYNQRETSHNSRRDTSGNNRRDTSSNKSGYNRSNTSNANRSTSNNRRATNRGHSRDKKQDTEFETKCEIIQNKEDVKTSSDIHERLAQAERIDPKIAMNLVQLFGDEFTIPFICRYRQDMINRNITPNKMRAIKFSYTNIIELKKRAESVVIELGKTIDLTEEVRSQILRAKTMKELEYLHALYKPVESSTTSIHTETYAYRLILGQAPMVHLNQIIDLSNPSLNTNEKVKESLCSNISRIFSKHSGIIDTLSRIQKLHKIVLTCEKIKTDTESPVSSESPPTDEKERFKQSKYETYFEFKNEIRYVKPYQILAINRGEKAKILNVQVVLPDSFKTAIREYVHSQFMRCGTHYVLRNEIFEMAFEKCYTENLAPLVAKQVRDNLTEMGKNDAIECFAKNLKQLLLRPPL